MRTLAIIQARTGSTRVAGKVFKRLAGRPVLEHVIRRVSASRHISEVFVATTVNKDDLRIVGFCAQRGTRVFCGSEDNVLDRFYQLARLMRPEHIVRFTADCPMLDPGVIDEVVMSHLRNRADYTSNVLKETFPDGEDTEIFTFAALEEAWNNEDSLTEREHVTTFIRNHPERFKLLNVACSSNLSAKRWTLDNEEDYRFLRIVFNELCPGDSLFGMKKILSFLKENPEIEKINRHIPRNVGLMKSRQRDRLEKERQLRDGKRHENLTETL